MSDYTPTMGELRATYIQVNTRNHDSYQTGRSLVSEEAHYGDEFDRAIAAHDAEVAAAIATAIRRNCTPSHEAYARGGDTLIAAVADWIENPPEWVDAPWAIRPTVKETPSP